MGFEVHAGGLLIRGGAGIDIEAEAHRTRMRWRLAHTAGDRLRQVWTPAAIPVMSSNRDDGSGT